MELFRVINDSDLIARPGKSVVLAGPSGEGCREDSDRLLNVNRLPQSEEKTVHIAGKCRNAGCSSIFHPDCCSLFFFSSAAQQMIGTNTADWQSLRNRRMMLEMKKVKLMEM